MKLNLHTVDVAADEVSRDDRVTITVENPGLKAHGADDQIEELVQDTRENDFSLVGARICPHSPGPVIGEEIESCILVHSARLEGSFVVHREALERLVVLVKHLVAVRCAHSTHLTGEARPQLEVIDLVVRDRATCKEVMSNSVLDFHLRHTPETNVHDV